LTYSDDTPATAPARLFLKLSRPDAEQRVVGSSQRQNEVVFHNRVAVSMSKPPIVRCYQAVYCEETGNSHLLFDDVTESHFTVRPTEPPPVPQAGKAIDAFAEVHASWWDHPELDGIAMPPSPASVAEHVANSRGSFARYASAVGDQLSDFQHQVYERTLDGLPRLWKRVTQGRNLTLIHGDASFSNVLLPYDPEKREALIVDWQLWGTSFGTEDLSHLIALFWDREPRQIMEKDLLMRYHQGLVRNGVAGYGWTDCWEDYRLAVLLRVLFMPMWFWLGGASDSYWKASLARAMQAVTDLECLELL